MDAAEQSDSVEDLRDRDRARLAILRDRLQPMFDGLPADGLFDLALARAGRPRLFLDMVAFVDIARDGRAYRLAMDARYGRRKIAESADLSTIEAAIRDYVARRLVEREKFLAEEDAAAFGPDARNAPTSALTRSARAPAPARTSARTFTKPPNVKTAAPARALARRMFGFIAEMIAAILVVAGLILALAKIAARTGA